MNIAIDYGGHDDIIRAVKGMIKDGINAEKVDKALFEKYLDTRGQPYPYVDLMIRTSGEQRTSGFYSGSQPTQKLTGRMITFRILLPRN